MDYHEDRTAICPSRKDIVFSVRLLSIKYDIRFLRAVLLLSFLIEDEANFWRSPQKRVAQFKGWRHLGLLFYPKLRGVHAENQEYRHNSSR
jgi:hypothetical protein